MSSIQTAIANTHWAVGEEPSVLGHIHKPDVNIAILERSIDPLAEELNRLIERDIEFKSSGNRQVVLDALEQAVELEGCPLVREDIKDLLRLFGGVTKASGFRLLLATVSSNMCTKFHTDVNDLRMLCTYRGPGTLWLTEDNINREALDCCEEEDCLIRDESNVQQVTTGAVVILKGAIYPKEGTTPILHRSPTIEENKVKRLLLRIDTNAFLDF